MKKNNINSLHISSLPESLSERYHILYPVSHSDKSSVYLLGGKNGDSKAVIKVMYADSHTEKMAGTLSELSCDYIFKPIDYYVEENIIYILYGYYIPLTDLLVDASLSLKEILCIGIDMCKALLYLHKNNIMHFDVSSGNIFQGNDGKYILGDYSNAVFSSSVKDEVNTGLKPQTEACVCDCRLLVTFLLTLLNRGETVASVSRLMEKELPKKLLYVLSVPDINFSNEDKLLEKLCSDLQDLSECEDIINSNYFIKINDKNHELITKKTAPLKKLRTERKDKVINKLKHRIKKENIKSFIPYIALFICGLIFIYSFYSFIVSVNNRDSKTNASEENGQLQTENKDLVCDVSGMGIKSFPKDLSSIGLDKYNYFELSDISILYAYSNNVTSLKGIDECGGMRELYLTDNKLSDLEDIIKLKRIEILVLSNNYIKDATQLAKLESLVFLDLSGNYGLKNIGALNTLPNLQILVLSHTGISKKEIESLRKKLPECEIVG